MPRSGAGLQQSELQPAFWGASTGLGTGAVDITVQNLKALDNQVAGQGGRAVTLPPEP